MIVLLKLLGVSGVALYTTIVMTACPVAGIVVLLRYKLMLMLDQQFL
jgi:hypothetical protein